MKLKELSEQPQKMNSCANMKYGIRSGPKEHTKYWAECDGVRIEFDIFDVIDEQRWQQYDEQFYNLFKYIKGQLITSDLTDEEYQAIVDRRSEAEKKAIEDRIHNPNSR